MKILLTVLLLSCSNVFMLFAWYGHLKTLRGKSIFIAIMVSWSIALFEYILQVPANRIGNSLLNIGQLKLLQEIITLTVFIPFSILFLKEKITTDYFIASIFILLAVFFVFRSKLFG